MSAFDAGAWWLDVVYAPTGDVLGQLQAENMRIVDRLNGGMELTATVRAELAGGTDLGVANRIVRAFQRDTPTGDRVLRFAGHVHEPLTDTGDADGGEYVELIAKSPWALMAYRYLDTNGGAWGYSATDAGAIAADLIARAREFYPPPPPYTIPDESEHGLGATVFATVNRDRGYDAGQPIGEAIAALAAIENGFDFIERPVDPWTWPVFSRLVIGDLATVVEDVRLEYGEGTVANVAGYRIDQMLPVNSIIATGAQDVRVQVFDEASIAGYGLWTRTISHPTVTDLGTLTAHANAALRPVPVDLVAVDLAGPQPVAADLGRFPRYWTEFQVGSILRVYIRGARRTLDVDALVREATVEVDAEGAERVVGLVLEVAA